MHANEAQRSIIGGAADIEKCSTDSNRYATEAGATRAGGPRITMQDIEQNIACEYSVNAGAMLGGGSVLARGGDGLHLLTVHFIVLKNGFTVIGKAAPVCRANFSAEYGRQLAREDAIRQIWPLMGYALRSMMPREAY